MSLLSNPKQSNDSPSQESQHQASDSHVSDVELLTQFLKLKNESAFAALVDRYGQMVFAVSLRIVRDRHSAEDVTQATFLLLAKDAKKIRRREALSSWLHGVAIRLAKKALKRRTREQVNDVVTELEAAEKSFAEIHSTFEQQVLDEELQQLPSQYREPLVLHFLQGKTYAETAQLLGVSIGAIEGRMKRGKRELHLRLTKRGVSLSAVLLALTWSQEAAATMVGPEIVHTIAVNGIAAFQGTAFAPTCSPEAVYLAGKEVTMLTMTKIALLTCGLAVATGAGWMTHAGLADDGKGSGAGAGGNVFGTVVDDSEQQSDDGVEVTQAASSEGSGISTDALIEAEVKEVENGSSLNEAVKRKRLLEIIKAGQALQNARDLPQTGTKQDKLFNVQFKKTILELMRTYEMLGGKISSGGSGYGGAAGGTGFGTVVDDAEQSAGGVEVTQAASSDELGVEGFGAESDDEGGFGFGGGSGGIGGGGAALDQRQQALQTAIEALRTAVKSINGQPIEGASGQPVNNQLKKAQVEVMRAYEMLAKQQEAKASQSNTAGGLSLGGAGTSSRNGGMGMMSGFSTLGNVNVTGDLITVEKNLSPQEEKINAALHEIIKIEFPGNPLSDVIDFIGDQHGIPILLDEVQLSDEGLSRDDEVQLVLSEATLKDALELMLKPLRLTYVTKNNVLMITTEVVADETLETRVYDVRSLNIEDPEAISDVITHGTSGEWQEGDGVGGEISFFNGSLVIRQTQRSHEEIETLLNQLARQFQSASENPQWPAKKRPIPVVPGGYGGGGGFY